MKHHKKKSFGRSTANSTKRMNSVSLFNVRWLYLILSLTVGICYVNSLNNGYSYNDDVVLSNPAGKNFNLISFPPKTGNIFNSFENPIPLITFFLENKICGFNPLVSHSINILLYVISVLLSFYLLSKYIFKNDYWIPFLAALLFGLHPVHTEVVNSLHNRGELLSVLFSLITMIYLLAYFEDKKIINAVIGIAAFLLSVLCSPLSVIAVIAMFFYYLLFYRNQYRLKPFLFISVLIAAGCLYLIYIYHASENNIYFVENPVVSAHSFAKFLIIGMVAIKYFQQLLLPINLSFYYGYNTLPVNKFIALLSLVFHSALIGAFFYYLNRNKTISFFIIFYLLSLIFYISLFIPYPGIISERAIYLASLPFASLFLQFLFAISGNAESFFQRKIFLYPVILLIFFYSIRTVTRNSNWKDTMSLMSHDINHLENSALANYLIADQFVKMYNTDGSEETKLMAKQYLKNSLDVLPDYSKSLNLMGYLYSTADNDTSKGLEYLQKAYRVSPDDPAIINNLALVYRKTSDTAKASSMYKKSMEVKPEDPWAYFYEAQLLFDSGKREEALRQNAQLLHKFPDLELAYLNYGTFYYHLGKGDSSLFYFELAVKHGARNSQLLNHLYNEFDKTGDQVKASYYEQLLKREGVNSN